MEHANTNPLGVEWIGLTMGLGFVLSFGYWCTNFLVVQRAMAAPSEEAARRVPLIAAIPKMFLPFLVILPGLIAVSVTSHVAGTPNAAGASSSATLPLDQAHPHGIVPVKTDPITGANVVDSSGQLVYDYNLTVPALLLHYFPTGILGLGLTALLASFMSGMAGNVTAFNTVWTYDIYQAYIHKNGTDAHYLWMGRMATVGGVLLSIGAAYAVTSFNNIMDALQLVFAVINAPLFATFLLGMFWKRTTGHAAFTGLTVGTLAAIVHHGLTLPLGDATGIHGGWIHVVYQYPSDMAQNFWTAIFAFVINFVVTVVISLVTKPRPEPELVGLVYSLTPKPIETHLAWYQKSSTLAIAVLAVAVVLNVIFR
jgi:SSS family solute:Na+ symporter